MCTRVCPMNTILYNRIPNSNIVEPNAYHTIPFCHQGKGHEDASVYQGVHLTFLGIGNIHVLSDSYQKLSEACRYVDQGNRDRRL